MTIACIDPFCAESFASGERHASDGIGGAPLA
jgi:hypothetical protein